MKQTIAELSANLTKLWSGPAVFAAVSLATVKDFVTVVVGIVTMICTIMVARSTIKKNNRES